MTGTEIFTKPSSKFMQFLEKTGLSGQVPAMVLFTSQQILIVKHLEALSECGTIPSHPIPSGICEIGLKIDCPRPHTSSPSLTQTQQIPPFIC